MLYYIIGKIYLGCNGKFEAGYGLLHLQKNSLRNITGQILSQRGERFSQLFYLCATLLALTLANGKMNLKIRSSCQSFSTINVAKRRKRQEVNMELVYLPPLGGNENLADPEPGQDILRKGVWAVRG